MQVPDRIILAGQNHHIGTSALPRELQLDNVVMPPERELIRVQTPPRSITLLDSPSSGIHMTNGYSSGVSSEQDDDTLIVEDNEARFIAPTKNGRVLTGVKGGLGLKSLPDSNLRKDSVEIDGDEIERMKLEINSLERRLRSVEEDVSASKDRETFIVMGALLYLTVQACRWLFKSDR